MADVNPRFPHWCRILRKTTENPMDEEEDFSPLETDDDYDPMGEEEDDNLVESVDDVSEDDGTETLVIYEGECRSYEKNTTSDKGDIITSSRGLALPLNQDGWEELGVVPKEGDEVIVVHGPFREYGRVIDKNIATARYAGTHLIWKYGRN